MVLFQGAIAIHAERQPVLRRLARFALRRADPTTATVAEIARRFQFSELGRFAVAYRRIFGEMPSITLSKALVELN
jgi:AraC-like DNA-binding protein